MNYTWSFPTLGVVFSQENLTDVIQTVNWVYEAKDGEYSSSCYGSIGLSAPNPASFTPYDQVTQAQVVEWTEAAMGPEKVAELQQSLAGQIAVQKKPKSGNLPPPWASN